MYTTIDDTLFPSDPIAWKALRYFNLYRIILAGFFVALIALRELPPPLGERSPLLFAIAAIAYLALAIVAQFATEQPKIPFNTQVVSHAIFDILAITLLMYASGGISSGFGTLLMISIIGVSILTTGKTTIAIAALATLIVLVEESRTASYAQASFYGATFMAIAFISEALTNRMRHSETLAAQRGADLENMALLNAHIIQRMRSGILVLDSEKRIRLVNNAAQTLLGLSPPELQTAPLALTGEFADDLTTWLQQPRPATHTANLPQTGKELLVSITDLGSDPAAGTLIFIEDATVTRQRAQQMKLASLGKLTASIAHEIRNPLGAISHAGQLLAEGQALGSEDQSLITIIRQQSERVNKVIDMILKLGRREQAAPETFPIKPWLADFVAELIAIKQLEHQQIIWSVHPEEIEVCMDANQLRQVLWNLCENGLRYSTGSPALELHCRLRAQTETPYLDIVDHGTGIPTEIASRIFEPFVTNSPGGTGLGLYIARELCEANQALLSLQENSVNGCCFRINFAHPNRQQVIV